MPCSLLIFSRLLIALTRARRLLAGAFASPLAAGALLWALAATADGQTEDFVFHGLRMEMRLPAIRAAGYGVEHFVDTTLSAQGFRVVSGVPAELESLDLYLYNHRLFQLDATYRPVRGDAAVALIGRLRRELGAPAGEFDPLRDDRWPFGGLTVHFSPGVADDGSLRPNLLITSEAVYREALQMKRNPPRNLVY